MLASKRNQLSCQDLRGIKPSVSSQLSERRSHSAQRPGYIDQTTGMQRSIPPRKSLDPIPTPRKSSKNRVSKYANPNESHYKHPSKVPIPVKGANQKELRSVQLLNLSTRIEDLTRERFCSSNVNSDESTCVEDSDTDTDIYEDIKPIKETVEKKIKTAQIRSIPKRTKDNKKEENPYEDVISVKNNNEYNPYDEITPRVKRKSSKNSNRKDSNESRKTSKENRKTSNENRKNSNESRKFSSESRKDSNPNRKESYQSRKESNPSKKESYQSRKESNPSRKDNRKTSSDKSDSSRGVYFFKFESQQLFKFEF